MTITINGKADEIAVLVLEIQERQKTGEGTVRLDDSAVLQALSGAIHDKAGDSSS